MYNANQLSAHTSAVNADEPPSGLAAVPTVVGEFESALPLVPQAVAKSASASAQAGSRLVVRVMKMVMSATLLTADLGVHIRQYAWMVS
jgi:hypothetical protein